MISKKNRKTLNHKTYQKQHISLMIMSDPTKSGKIVKIPLWLRYPIFIFVVCIISGAIWLFHEIGTLEAVITTQSLEIQTNNYTINEKNSEIDTLTDENQKRYEELQELQTMTEDLADRLIIIESYKENLDEKVNSTEKTTETKPSGYNLQKESHDQLILTGTSFDEFADSTSDDFSTELVALSEGLEKSLDMIESDIEAFGVLDEQLDEIIPYWDSYPSIIPLDDTRVTSSYGYRRDPITYRTSFHSGVDFAASYDPVYATGDGVVVDARYDGSYGYNILIDHGYGLMTRYAHLSRMYVSVGDEVERGDTIAKSGQSGRGTGPHLHYEVIENGEVQNPIDYIYKGE